MTLHIDRRRHERRGRRAEDERGLVVIALAVVGLWMFLVGWFAHMVLR